MKFNLVSPKTKDDLLRAIGENQGRRFRFGAGYTDLILELRKQEVDGLTVINLARLTDPSFTSIEVDVPSGGGPAGGGCGLRLGALVTAGKILSNKVVKEQVPVLYEAALSHASPQIRRVATIGGNVCTASPAGDMACALVALRAWCELLSAAGKTRVVPISDFFVGVRETCLGGDEILHGLMVPPGGGEAGKTYSGFIKVGTRRSMECAIVSIAYHISLGKDDVVSGAGIAIGSAAPTIRFVQSACDYLVGKKLSSMGPDEAGEFASKLMEYASPISDIRASAWYREDVLYNISRSIVENR